MAAAVVHHQASGMPADGDVLPPRTCVEINDADGAAHRHATLVHANGFRSRIAALARRGLPRGRLCAAENGYVRCMAVAGDDGRNWLDAEVHGPNECSGFRVEDSE